MIQQWLFTGSASTCRQCLLLIEEACKTSGATGLWTILVYAVIVGSSAVEKSEELK